MGRDERPLGHGLSTVHDDVVGKDDGDPKCETGQLAVLTARHAQAEPDKRKDEARDRDRKLAMDLHDRPVGRQTRVAQPLSFCLQLGNRQFGVPALRSYARKHRIWVQANDDLFELVDLIRGGVVRVYVVTRSFLEDNVHATLVAVEDDLPTCCNIHVRLKGTLACLRQRHLSSLGQSSRLRACTA